MNNKLKKNGFSLTEVLLAVATLAIGMLFIAGTFLVGIHFSTIATERTIAAVTADEAFAKVRLFGSPNTAWVSALSSTDCVDFSGVVGIGPDEFAYPSTNTVAEKQYYWSALCRRVGSDSNRLVQVTVFMCRKVGSGTTYQGGADRPIPVQVGVSIIPGIGNEKKLSINVAGERTFINDGYTIVDNGTGGIYRVLERYVDNPGTPIREDQIIVLDRPWLGGPTGSVWVVPPAAGGGRYPCIAVYQKIMRF